MHPILDPEGRLSIRVHQCRLHRHLLSYLTGPCLKFRTCPSLSSATAPKEPPDETGCPVTTGSPAPPENGGSVALQVPRFLPPASPYALATVP